MKQVVKVRDSMTGEVTVGESVIRNYMHLEVQLANRMHTFRPKKGKGSYERHPKHRGSLMCE